MVRVRFWNAKGEGVSIEYPDASEVYIMDGVAHLTKDVLQKGVIKRQTVAMVSLGLNPLLTIEK